MSSQLKIKWEWESNDSARAREHAATWARLEIWAGEDCVTLVEDADSGSSRRSIYCPLYPLAEWMAYSWWSLQADSRLAHLAPWKGSRQLSPRLRRHSLRASGDGFSWPNLLIVPEGGETHLLWHYDRAPLAGRKIKFLTSGSIYVNSAELKSELENFVTEVIGRLVEQGLHGTPLQKEWQEIVQAEPEEVDFCLAAARLGLDPYSNSDDYADDIIQASERLSGDLLKDFLDAVEPSQIGAALTWVESAHELVKHGEATSSVADLRVLKSRIQQELSPAAAFPWERGYEQARSVRRALELEPTGLFSVEEFVASVRHNINSKGLLAAGGSYSDVDPVVVVGQDRAASSRRFTLTRALWHYLWGPQNSLFLVTSAVTDRQKVERAFAAELLAPAEGVARLLGGPVEESSPEDLEQIAQDFGVSPIVIHRQVQNQLLCA